MLAVQVDFWKLQEQKRHNAVTEKQTDTSLQIQQGQLDLGWANLSEVQRHNQATESLGVATLAETITHNRQTESLQSEANQIGWFNADTNRMNADTNRAHLAVDWANVQTQRERVANDYEIGTWNADINQQNAVTRAGELALSRELEPKRVQAQSDNARASLLNAETNAYNAATNRYGMLGNLSVAEKNAETNRIKVDYDYELGQGNLDMRKAEFIEKMSDDAFDNLDQAVGRGLEFYKIYSNNQFKLGDK